MDIFDLTPNQQKAFNRLKKAYKDCQKEGVLFINNYGDLQAVDKKIICGYGDSMMHANGVSEVSILEARTSPNSMKITNEWTDDEHFYGLTKLGHKIYFENES